MSTATDIALEDAEFFRSLLHEQLRDVERLLAEKSIARSQVIFFAGAPADHLWCIRRGDVRLYANSRGGRITTLETLGPGEIFGAVSALDESAYPVSAEGVSEGSAWCLPRAHFLRLLDEDPRLSRELLDIISRRLRGTRDRLRSFAHDSASCRLAQALLRASPTGEAVITRRELAETAGTTVETAIRVLRGFQHDNIICGRVGRIAVLDRSQLERIANPAER